MIGRRDARDERVDLPGLATGWDAGRTERLLGAVHVRLARRRRAWRAAIAGAGAASAVAIALFALRADRAADGPAPVARAIAPVSEAAAVPGVIRLREGSEIRLDPASAEVRVIEDSAARVRVELVRGASRYAVVRNPARTFEVHAGAVTVRVVGTEFVVERRGDAAWVEVTRGKVAVSAAAGDAPALLAAGDSGLFPRAATPTAPAGVTPAHDADPAAGRAHRASQAYRSQVAHRDYRGAYAALARNPGLAGDTVDDLLVAADVARLSHHPAEAVPFLQRILREHARDERAPMAAFTLGRTLSGLGRTRDAMAMFARVHGSWPRSPLAEDALVREAEAASALGDVAAAARLAAMYDRAYPNGHRSAEIRRHARLE
jgi:transmembrane sensor